MSFYEKYLKYKQKYIDLKNLSGGASSAMLYSSAKLYDFEDFESWNEVRLRKKLEESDPEVSDPEVSDLEESSLEESDSEESDLEESKSEARELKARKLEARELRARILETRILEARELKIRKLEARELKARELEARELEAIKENKKINKDKSLEANKLENRKQNKIREQEVRLNAIKQKRKLLVEYILGKSIKAKKVSVDVFKSELESIRRDLHKIDACARANAFIDALKHAFKQAPKKILKEEQNIHNAIIKSGEASKIDHQKLYDIREKVYDTVFGNIVNDAHAYVDAHAVDARAVDSGRAAAVDSGRVTAAAVDSGRVTAAAVDSGRVTAAAVDSGRVAAVDSGRVTAAAVDSGRVAAIDSGSAVDDSYLTVDDVHAILNELLKFEEYVTKFDYENGDRLYFNNIATILYENLDIEQYIKIYVSNIKEFGAPLNIKLKILSYFMENLLTQLLGSIKFKELERKINFYLKTLKHLKENILLESTTRELNLSNIYYGKFLMKRYLLQEYQYQIDGDIYIYYNLFDIIRECAKLKELNPILDRVRFILYLFYNCLVPKNGMNNTYNDDMVHADMLDKTKLNEVVELKYISNHEDAPIEELETLIKNIMDELSNTYFDDDYLIDFGEGLSSINLYYKAKTVCEWKNMNNDSRAKVVEWECKQINKTFSRFMYEIDIKRYFWPFCSDYENYKAAEKVYDDLTEHRITLRSQKASDIYEEDGEDGDNVIRGAPGGPVMQNKGSGSNVSAVAVRQDWHSSDEDCHSSDEDVGAAAAAVRPQRPQRPHQPDSFYRRKYLNIN